MSSFMSMWLDALYDYVFKPKGTPSPTPSGTPSVVTPSENVPVNPSIPDPLVSQVTALMLKVNNEWPYPPNGVWVSSLSGSSIHKLTQATAAAIAPILIAACKQYGVPLAYLMACIDIESVFDPLCDNPNKSWIGHTGSNPENVLQGHDVGFCQIKLRFLMSDENMALLDAQKFALDPSKAIPHMAKAMAGLLAGADAEIATFSGRSDITPQFRNRYFYATCAYNFGATGVQSMLTDTAPNHGLGVVQREQDFSRTLGQPSVFTDITG